MSISKKLARYKIWQLYYGKFDNKHVVGYARDLQHAKLLVDALMSFHADRPITYYYELVDDYDEILDEIYDLDTLFKEC